MKKKGFMIGSMVDVYAILLFVFSLIIFILILSFNNSDQQIVKISADSMSELDANIELINTLRVPVSFDYDGDNKVDNLDMSELVLITFQNESYLPTLKDLLLPKLNKYGGDGCYSILFTLRDVVLDKDLKYLLVSSCSDDVEEIGSAKIPSFKVDQEIIAQLRKSQNSDDVLVKFVKPIEVINENSDKQSGVLK